ncbi:dTDP-4-amino-4,6-dideoxygalactose transaminase [Lysinibacillus halotolerans]|uniref:dTDP-4-amino-4,6-dideoxygalactose transaminase n=1 Tax=Lysinibacillus halotolerans TaxID=1368476 RepID=A0A3M8HH56_9BACI|nr:dTDP-4-amino-4,6-dideoxygalactose transaminase [Lysinibacillus halotolerans]RND01798.1 dTDP-4-amino-4,6-dideoxygalactose transaminase [Lysinibacillus halotolerans]
MIQSPFNVPPVTGAEFAYIQDVIESRSLSGDGKYTKLSQIWLEQKTGTKKALLTTSCTHALEMAAFLINIQPGDEVIMPSYTFTSTANAFVLRGAKIVFVDIRPDTMNIDENKIEAAITKRTKAIVPVHYAGVSCEMDTIMDIAHRYQLYVIEDAAQGLMGTYKGRMLGTIGHIGTYSFHETKNFVSGEGGALLINDERFIERAEIIREKGTDRSQFFRGQVDKYCWQDIGSSYLPSELNAAYLYAQLEQTELILESRLSLWNEYYTHLQSLEEHHLIDLPVIPNNCQHNGHIFYIKVKNGDIRTSLINYLKAQGIQSMFHFVPLHSSPAGKRYTTFHGEDIYTTVESERLLRLPLYFDLSTVEVIVLAIKGYFMNMLEKRVLEL